jgi:hypothetical protein
MIPRWMERLGGLGLLALGAWMIVASWRAAHAGEGFFVMGPAFGPFAIGVGTGLLLFPSPRSLVAARGGDGSKITWADLTTGWKVLAGGGAVLGIGYLLLLLTGLV